MKLAAFCALTCACGGMQMAGEAMTSHGQGAVPPAFDASNAGKNDTVGYMVSMTPTTVSWGGAWVSTATQSVTPGPTPCSMSFAVHVERVDDGGKNTYQDERGGAVDFGASASIGAGFSFWIQVSDSQVQQGNEPAGGTIAISSGQQVSLYFTDRSARDSFAAAARRLHDLCVLGREPN